MSELTDLIRVVKPSIVGILTEHPIENDKLVIIGSGFVTKKDNIVTCNHVINGVPKIYVLAGNTTMQAVVLSQSKERDFAILKIEKNLPGLNLGSFSDADEGDEVFFCGYPFGMPRMITHTGTVSYKGLVEFPEDDALPSNCFQIDGIINRGNSGGPLFSFKSKNVLGLVRSTHGGLTPYLKAIKKGEIRCAGIGLGQIDIGRFVWEIADTVDRHIQMGIGYALSIDYMEEGLKDLRSKKKSCRLN